MTTQTTTTTLTAQNFVMTTREEFVSFIMDRKVKFTVTMLDNELRALDVVGTKGLNKEEKAGLLFDKLEALGLAQAEAQAQAQASVEEVPAQAPVEVEVDTPEATEEFSVSEALAAVRNRKNEAAIAAYAARTKDVFITSNPEKYMNPGFVDMMAKVNAAKNSYLHAIGENAVTVEALNFYPANRVRQIKTSAGNPMRFIGDVIVRLPQAYAQIKVWNPKKVNKKGGLGAPDFVDFNGFDLDTTTGPYNMRRGLATGSNLVKLSIFTFTDEQGVEGPAQVALPTEKGTDGTRYEIFRTADVRVAKTKDAEYDDQPLYLRDNNEWFNAQVSAFIQFARGEFVQANPENNHGFDKKHCQNMVRFGVKDGLLDDVNEESTKNKVIIQQPDIMQLAQVGPNQPQAYCMVLSEWLDEEAVDILNDADKFERGGDQFLTDEETAAYEQDKLVFNTEVRYQRHDEVVVSGKLMKKADVRDSVIESKCATCPFYCGNSPKSEAQVTKERVDGATFVNSFYRERPKANAQVIQTLVKDGESTRWVRQYPHELLGKVTDILAFRVKSGGLTVYGSPAVMGIVNPAYAVPVEAFDAQNADIMKKVNQIFHFAFNMDKMTAEQSALVFKMIEHPPAMNESQTKRWNKALFWLVEALGWAEERRAASEIAPFAKRFLVGTHPGTTEIHVEDVMADTMYRAETGQLGWGLGYDDLSAKEFVRYLDEIAIDYVYDCILDGETFSLVGGSAKDKELAAGALQEMLQRELNTFIYGVRRDENPATALAGLKLHADIKVYLQQVLGL